MLLEPGSVLTIRRALFHVGQQSDSKIAEVVASKLGGGMAGIADKMTSTHTHAGSAGQSTAADIAIAMSSNFSTGSSQAGLRGGSKRKNKKGLARALQAAAVAAQAKVDKLIAENSKCNYNLTLTFEKPTIYLAVPYKTFGIALRESGYDAKTGKFTSWNYNRIMQRKEN